MKDRFKFRVWLNKLNRYSKNTDNLLLSEDGNVCEFDIVGCYSEKDVVIQQCTGLKDKNGKLIYEGDIVKLPTQCNKELHGSYSLQEIVWRNGNWILSYISSEKGSKLPRGWTAGFLHNYWSDEFEKEFIFTNADIFCTYNELEVIGNIYENKDLLKDLLGEKK